MARLAVLLWLVGGSLSAQETVIQYFERMSVAFGNVRDYVATWKMDINGRKQQATVYYKAPDQFLMKYSQPEGRFVLIRRGQVLIYNPQNNIVLRQNLEQDKSLVLGSRSLSLLQSHYLMRFKYPEGASPRMEEGIGERVVALRLVPKNAALGISELEVLFDASNNMMRRLSGVWYGQNVVYDFLGVSLNQNLEDSLFDYLPPAGGKEWNNFLQG